MLVMMHAGTTNADQIADLTALNRDFVRLRCKRLRDNGVIPRPGHFVVEWFDEDWRIANISFILDVLVAEGHATRTGGGDAGRPQYLTTKTGEAAIAR